MIKNSIWIYYNYVEGIIFIFDRFSANCILDFLLFGHCHFDVGTCVFVDAEHALDPALARAIGVNTQNLLLSQPDCGEQALSLVDTLIRSGSVDVVVVDSVSKVLLLPHVFIVLQIVCCWWWMFETCFFSVVLLSVI